MKKKLVVLTGAGISAESGLQTFRDAGGLWEGYEITEVATPDAWKRNPALVLDFYNMRRDNVRAARPNAAHLTLASLENEFDVTIITQNIDDLHERGGSTNVMHLHGEILKMRSEKNHRPLYDVPANILPGDMAPDGGQLRPHIVWFGEEVPMMEKAIPVVQQADYFAVVGTSLLVYPAASLVGYVRAGIPLFVVDKQIPASLDVPNLYTIEKPATTGVQDLSSALKQLSGSH